MNREEEMRELALRLRRKYTLKLNMFLLIVNNSYSLNSVESVYAGMLRGENRVILAHLLVHSQARHLVRRRKVILQLLFGSDCCAPSIELHPSLKRQINQNK